MADISALTTGENTLDILHPGTGAKLGITVTLMHIDDPRLAKLKRQFTDQKNKLVQRGQIVKADEIENNAHMLTFRAMTDWHWGADEDGEPATFKGEAPEFNQKNVLEVLKALPWFADQVQERMGETEAFFTNSKSA